jgi:hypothetical protein
MLNPTSDTYLLVYQIFNKKDQVIKFFFLKIAQISPYRTVSYQNGLRLSISIEKTTKIVRGVALLKICVLFSVHESTL